MTDLRTPSASSAPFGLYLHWPFCARKCPYCDFNSHVRARPVDEARFIRAFVEEMRFMHSRTGSRRLSSVFFGGGTPSLMQPQSVATLLDAAAGLWSFEEGIEITLEANPSSVEAERFHAYYSAGVNRLSLGVQALHDDDLQALGRMHNTEQALFAMDLARKIFPRLSFDLIYARPNQSIKAWEAELHKAIDLAADHLSLYQLTLEPNTHFYKLYQAGRLVPLPAEKAADLYNLTQEVTEVRGLPAYEISNHAVKGAEARHNLLYWRYQDYVGVGPGAHGRFLEGLIKQVFITEKHPENWLKRVEMNGHGIVEEEALDATQQGDECLLMGLRLYEGLDLNRYRAVAQRDLPSEPLTALQKDGLVEMVGNHHLRASIKGRPLLDYIIRELAT